MATALANNGRNGLLDQEHELSDFEARQSRDESVNTQSLPRADGGRAAWLFLTACFLLEALVWGFPFSFGVFQVYYSNHDSFMDDLSGIAAIGTTATGIMYLCAPLAALATQKWPRIRHPGMCLGLAIMVIALLSASFCDRVGSLIATQGVLYAFGGLIIYFPSMQYLDEWFILRKGFAYGVMWAGTGTAGIVVPFLLQWLLGTYGYRTTLRVWAITMTVLTTPCLFFVKPRLPITANNRLRPSDLSFLTRPTFYFFLVGQIAQSLGFFLPQLWMPSFANAIGLPPYAGPLGLALSNLAYCIGAIFLGALVDRFHVSTAILISTLGQMVSIFILWGLTTTQPMLYLFAIVWGIFGGGFSATWPGCAAAMRHDGRSSGGNVDTGVVISLLAAGKGVGAVISGPLSTQLLAAGWRGHLAFAYGSGYGLLIVFAGVSATLGGTAWVGRMLKLV